MTVNRIIVGGFSVICLTIIVTSIFSPQFKTWVDEQMIEQRLN
jgi:hypothetical protein